MLPCFMRCGFFIFLIILFGGYGSAHAATLENTRAALYAGRYDFAYMEAQTLGTPQGLILAAEALNAKLLLGDTKHPKKTAKSAMKLAKQALASAPDNPQAQMQYAIAYGFYGRHVSAFKAWRKNIPMKIHSEILKVVTLNGDFPQTAPLNHALQGAWHLSVVARAGPKRALRFYNASEEAGLRHFEMALQIDANDIIIATNYTLMRYILSPQSQSQWAITNLNAIVKMPAHNAIERQVQARVQIILDNSQHPDIQIDLIYAFLS